MSVFIKSFYQKFFPARQLLIRQNGEVKNVVLAPWFQLFTVLLILGTITWVGISSFRVYSQTNKITDIEQSQIDKQQAWQKQVQEQKALHAKQLEQLAVLEQKQALLQGMIESLPASISKETIKLEEQLESPVNQDKVDRLKKAIQSGEYKVNPEVLANKIAKLEGEIFGTK